ncbi:DUF1450 domain-containing protein [Terrisporobacter mayombei]|uniref:DUF1450 domain-containing protein n=1 Tax=Terrisporobacter mayombei TaxID=1541 RepID=A0ABY9PXV7_9FIRM|nr:DUF1450 domain-containing protein [Terrisporobacter mayombei]MCC3868380.1 DUF1450 domain-containing protein [Terrisporobacter mayombei]WMT80525.1 hypothetical protein TEMA_08440 [Terrisporobacter mayombei]
MSKLVRVCPSCSNVDVDKLKKIIGEENVKIGCVGACRKEKVHFFGRINGAYVMTKNEEEFFDQCK